MNPLDLERLESLTLDGESVAELRYMGQAIWQGKTHVIRLNGTAEVRTRAAPGLLLIVPDAFSAAVEAAMATEAEPAVLLVHPTEISPEVCLTLAVRPKPCVTLIQPDNMQIYISADLNELMRQDEAIGASNISIHRVDVAETAEMEESTEPAAALLTIRNAGKDYRLNLLGQPEPNAQKIKMVPAEAREPLRLMATTAALAQLEPSYRIADLPDAAILQRYVGSGVTITVHPVVKNEPLPILHRYSGSGSLMVILPVASQESPTIEATRASSGTIVTVLLLPVVSGDEVIRTATEASGSMLTADPQAVSVSGLVDTGSDARTALLTGDGQNVNVGIAVAEGQTVLVDKVQTKGEEIKTEIPLETAESLRPQKTVTDSVATSGAATTVAIPDLLVHVSSPDELPVATLLAVKTEESVIIEMIDGQWEYPYMDGTKLVIRQVYSSDVQGKKIIIR